jgi:aspartate/methionine/tyrosine aminotransferase
MPKYTDRLDLIPTYPFAKVGRLSREVQLRDKINVINVRIGIPDIEAPIELKKLLSEFVLEKNSTYGYPVDVHPETGIPEFLDAVIQHYDERHGTDLKKEEIMITGYTKTVLHNLARLFEPGVVVDIEPRYPAYGSAALLAGHKIRVIKTSEDSNWIPSVTFQENDRLFYFCDPNNPTGSVASEKTYMELLREIKRYNVGGIFDKAYKDYVFEENVKPISITEIPELMEYGFEVVSFSKHTNCVGVGIGFIVSNAENIDRWKKLSSYFSQGIPWYKQKAAVEALTNSKVKNEMKKYFEKLKERRRLLVNGLNQLGFQCKIPKATPYIFAKIPEFFGDNDEDFALNLLLDKAHVATMPGSYFGESGKGYVRVTMFVSKQEIQEALKRIEDVREW